MEPEIRKLGCEFVVATEVKIRVQPLLENVKIVRGDARTPFRTRQVVLCRKFLHEHEGASIADLVGALSGQGVTLPVVYALIYWGTLAIDFNLPLDPRGAVRPAVHASGKEGR